MFTVENAAEMAISLSRLHPVGPSHDVPSPVVLTYGGNQDALALLKERRLAQQS